MIPLTSPDAITVGAVLATCGWLYTAKRARTLAKKQHTINIMLKGNFDKDLRVAHESISKYLKGIIPFPELDSNEYKRILPSLRFVLNHYEFLAAGIRRGDVDEKLVLDSERGTILNAYEKSMDHIFAVRTNRRNQAVYEHLEWLHKRWESSPPSAIYLNIERIKGAPLQGKRNEVRGPS